VEEEEDDQPSGVSRRVADAPPPNQPAEPPAAGQPTPKSRGFVKRPRRKLAAPPPPPLQSQAAEKKASKVATSTPATVSPPPDCPASTIAPVNRFVPASVAAALSIWGDDEDVLLRGVVAVGAAAAPPSSPAGPPQLPAPQNPAEADTVPEEDAVSFRTASTGSEIQFAEARTLSSATAAAIEEHAAAQRAQPVFHLPAAASADLQYFINRRGAEIEVSFLLNF